METWFFTFGSAHKDSDGRSLGQRFVKLQGTIESTRDKMFEARGAAWAFQYDVEGFNGQAERYGLSEVSLEDVCVKSVQR